MKIVRQLTQSQVKRLKVMYSFSIAALFLSVLSSTMMAYATHEEAEIMTGPTSFEGPYMWAGTDYAQFERTDQYGGYIEEYTNKENFCTSYVILPGTSLLDEKYLGVLYLLILLYIFLGVAIVSDLFMESIETITSKVTAVQIVDSEGKIITVEKPVWNPTIANLTLMALGSSAPEILLSCIEVISKMEETPSELGPQSIVGSAAFNLLVISGVSIMAVEGEVKKIFDMGVFITTAVSSVFAYVWLFLVLQVITPGEVTLLEAILTFSFFIILVLLAYGADRYKASTINKEDQQADSQRAVAKTALRAMADRHGTFNILECARGDHPKSMTDDQVTLARGHFKNALEAEDLSEFTIDQFLEVLNPENPLERIMYRKKVSKATTNRLEFVKMGETKGHQMNEAKDDAIVKGDIGFRSLKYSVVESGGAVQITIEKKVQEDRTFWVKTINGSAVSPNDYKEKNELITMKAHEKERNIQIDIVNDSEWEPDKDFYVELREETEPNVKLEGGDTKCVVTILDEDRPGIIGFRDRFLTVKRKDKYVYLYLERADGCDGEISCMLNTRNNIEALGGKKQASEYGDYEPIRDRRMTFANNVSELRIEVAMPECKEDLGDDDVITFALEICDPEPAGCRLSKKNLCFIDIVPSSAQDDEREDLERRKMLEYFMAAKEPSWGQQFKLAVMLGPQIDDEDRVDDVELGEAIMHFLTVPWKVVFALVPPRHLAGGWLAFGVALAIIGVVTAVVGEVATLLGCAIDLKTSVTAITIVAMGTSLPDTFASRTAAISSQYADSAVGNVTGSNSVNVFLGLGLPWLIATIYWMTVHDANYTAPAGSLAFSVVLFTATSLCCFAILGVRRCVVGGELGGKGCARPFSAFLCFSLWVIYVIGCTLQAYGYIDINLDFSGGAGDA